MTDDCYSEIVVELNYFMSLDVAFKCGVEVVGWGSIALEEVSLLKRLFVNLTTQASTEVRIDFLNFSLSIGTLLV